MDYSARYMSPVGPLVLACEGERLTGLWMEGQKYFGAPLLETAQTREDHPILVMTKNWLDRYFSGARPAPSELPLAPAGGEFRQLVWRLLCQIPYGQTATYGALAQAVAAELGRTHMSAQAVGGAVGHNPISIVIPCHRVVGADGSLTGYAGGMEKKRKLLEWEGSI